MADDDQTSLGDEEQSFLLSGSSSLGDSIDFDAATGIDAGNLGRTIVGTIGLALGTAAATFVGGVTEAWTRAIDGVAGFYGGTREIVTSASRYAGEPVYRDVPGVIETVANSWVSAMRGAWSSALPESGIASWLFALLIVFGTFYLAARGISEVSEVLGR